MSVSGPDPIDVGVGLTIKRLRKERNLSQDQLGRALGVTFQQVQKYERGTNRISASMLVRAAGAFGVHPAVLLPDEGEAPASEDNTLHLMVRTKGGEELVENFGRISSARVRRAILGMVKGLANSKVDLLDA